MSASTVPRTTVPSTTATRRRRPRRALATVLTAAGAATALCAALLGSTATAAVPPAPAGWTTVWSDDFGGAANTLPSGADWIVDTGTSYPGGAANWGTGEVQTYTADTANLRQDGAGNLRITPIRDANGNWTSGRIETRRSDFEPPAGGKLRIESRIQMPNVTGPAAAGYWPAFWTLGAPYRGNYWNWPSIGEFDLMENVNGVNQVWGTLHCGGNPGGPCNETTGLGAVHACPGSACQGNFHTYALEWDRTVSPQQLRWYVDGVQYHSVTSAQMDAASWDAATAHGHFILLNVAMGGAFPDPVAGYRTPTASTASGVPMLVDYVAVYSSGGTGTPPPTTQPPTTPPPTTTPPTTTPPPGGTGSAYGTIQAEAYSGQSGTALETTTDSGGGQNLAALANGDWALYPGVDFGSTPARQFKARVASGAAGGVSGLVEVRLDSRTSAPVGSFAVANTGGWQSWTTVPANISAVTGKHDVYLTFTSGQPADFVNVNWFTFSTT
ncbi:glycoside hydrolase family 16 protein [Kitasatospora sp. NPDC056181]|uniref:glycoside hydrolase family 16 protein n=1 Tax=Kitasatospora sp. NPDC056181 TaxID=3345737 RepID=UPI0035DBCF67